MSKNKDRLIIIMLTWLVPVLSAAISSLKGVEFNGDESIMAGALLGFILGLAFDGFIFAAIGTFGAVTGKLD